MQRKSTHSSDLAQEEAPTISFCKKIYNSLSLAAPFGGAHWLSRETHTRTRQNGGEIART